MTGFRGFLIVGVGLLGLLAFLYRSEGTIGNKECLAAKPVTERLMPLARGEMAAFSVPGAPRKLPDLAFQDVEGKKRTLAGFQGRVVLLNLWATWCAPCRKEMPALDAVQKVLGGPGFEVVAVNLDTRDPEKATRFLGETGIRNLAFYADPQAKVFQDLKRVGKAVGMPTTLLVSKEGCELGMLSGAADWGSAGGLALIRAAIEP